MILEKAVLEIYPDAIVHVDFLIIYNLETEKQEIAHWNEKKYRKPTEAELQEAWKRAAKKDRKEEFRIICEEKIVEGFTSSNGHFYRTNDRDQSNMTGRKEFLRDHPDVNIVMWKTEDMGYLEHTRDEWINKVYYEALTHIETQLFRYNTLKAEVEKCENLDDLKLLKWE